jgi:hypothetical protein
MEYQREENNNEKIVYDLSKDGELLSDTMKTLNTVSQPVSSKLKASNLIRCLGILLTGVGGIMLLLQGFSNIDVTYRFMSFSGFLGVTAYLGLYLSQKKKDYIGARMLLAAFLILVPVFWSQLGALLYLYWNQISIYDSTHSAVSTVTVVIGCILAIVMITPLSWMIARVSIPQIPNEYTAVVVLLGGLLCLTVRENVLADVLIMISILITRSFYKHYFHGKEYAKTQEAKIALMVLLTFPGIFIGRGIYYNHIPTVVNTGFLCIIIGLFFRFLLDLMSLKNPRLLHTLDTLFTVFGVTLLGVKIFAQLPASMNEVKTLLQMMVPGSYLLITSKSDTLSFRWGIVLLALATLALHDSNSLLLSFSEFVIPIICLLLAVNLRSMFPCIVSFITITVHITSLFSNMWVLFHEFHWPLFMVAGIGLIFGASYYEGIYKKIKMLWDGKKGSEKYYVLEGHE